MKKLIVKNPWKASVGSDEMEWYEVGSWNIFSLSLSYAHTYIYLWWKHTWLDAAATAVTTTIAFYSLKPCWRVKTCVYGKWKNREREKCMRMSIGMRMKLKKILPPPIHAYSLCCMCCGMNHSDILRVTISFSSHHATDHHPPPSSHTIQTFFFSQK